MLHKPELAENILIGGLVLVAYQACKQFFPTLNTGLSGMRGRGMGVIGTSSFTYPQSFAKPGNFSQFVVAPDYAKYTDTKVAAALAAPAAAGNRIARRGRMS